MTFTLYLRYCNNVKKIVPPSHNIIANSHNVRILYRVWMFNIVVATSSCAGSVNAMCQCYNRRTTYNYVQTWPKTVLTLSPLPAAHCSYSTLIRSVPLCPAWPIKNDEKIIWNSCPYSHFETSRWCHSNESSSIDRLDLELDGRQSCQFNRSRENISKLLFYFIIRFCKRKQNTHKPKNIN